jgi:hypothetical protein
VAALVVAAALAGPACGRSREAPDPGPVRCRAPLAVPDGFRVTDRMQDPHPDRIGLRLDIADDRGRELHYFSGIQGEFGEGLPDRGRLVLRDGGSAALVGGGLTWALVWTTGSPCTPAAVLGTGMGRGEFRDLLQRAGALPQT